MTDAPPADDVRTQILDAAEALLRRHGPEKLSVSDVARSLGMSHANVYRYFASKTELFQMLVRRWLGRLEGPLAAIVASDAPPPERLKQWALTLHRQKREKVGTDPEMFASFHKASSGAGVSTGEHLTVLRAQIDAILQAGKAQGLWPAVTDSTADDVFTALSPFSHPVLVQADGAADRSAQLSRVVDLLEAGLRR